MWKSRLAAVLVAMPVVAVAVFFIWQSIGGDPPIRPFFDHYLNGRYEQALVEAQKLEASDYRVPVYRAAAYAQLGRIAEAGRALEEVQARGFELPDDLRRDMIERHAMAPAVVDELLAGLAKMDADTSPPTLQ